MRRFLIAFFILSALACGEPITREAVEKRLASLEEVRRQTLANLNALNGAVEDCKYWLDHLDAAKPAAAKPTAPAPKAKPGPAADNVAPAADNVAPAADNVAPAKESK